MIPQDLKEVLVSLVSVSRETLVHQLLITGLLADELPSSEARESLNKVMMHDFKSYRKTLADLGRKVAAL